MYLKSIKTGNGFQCVDVFLFLRCEPSGGFNPQTTVFSFGGKRWRIYTSGLLLAGSTEFIHPASVTQTISLSSI